MWISIWDGEETSQSPQSGLKEDVLAMSGIHRFSHGYIALERLLSFHFSWLSTEALYGPQELNRYGKAHSWEAHSWESPLMGRASGRGHLILSG